MSEPKPFVSRNRKNRPTDTARWNQKKQRKVKQAFIERHGETDYICWICKRPVEDSKVTIDHVLSMSEYPEYVYEPSNLRPAHMYCNTAKHFWDTIPNRTLKFKPQRRIFHSPWTIQRMLDE